MIERFNETRGRTVAIIQARYDSTRLPGKTALDLAGQPVMARVLDRVNRAQTLDQIVVATGDAASNAPLIEIAEEKGFLAHRGAELDVLARYCSAARASDADVIVRITSDCPLIDPDVIDQVVRAYHASKADFVSNTQQRSFPDGLDVEVFSRKVLERANDEADDPFLRGHVTPYIHGRLKNQFSWGKFSVEQVVNQENFSFLRWTLDEDDDLEFIREVFAALKEPFGWLEVVALQMQTPRLMRINSGHEPYEGSGRDIAVRANVNTRSYDRSRALFARASQTVPSASQTFSKSSLQWPLGTTPQFLERSRGCRTWDVDGHEYIDYVLGLLPIILGHGDVDVDTAVDEQLRRGVTYSLATELECELAERLVRLIPGAEQVRIGKNGSDATTAAVRLARAYTGREKIAVSGYHGWHDWYIASTVRNVGIPQSVQALTTRFPFGNADALQQLLSSEPESFAAIIMEPDGVVSPPAGYLEAVRDICNQYDVLVIFDEIISGFRASLGGAQERHGVTPDLASFGKAMGNGFPISAIVGRQDVMSLMNDVFVSGTFGGEALSIAASIATIDKLERLDVPDRLERLGTRLIDASNAIVSDHQLECIVSFGGHGWWPRIIINPGDRDAALIASLFRQFSCQQGLLLGNSYNLCLAHDSEVVFCETMARLDQALTAFRDALDDGDGRSHLQGDHIEAVFTVR